MENTLLATLKTYFNIESEDTSKDPILQVIIDQDEDLLEDLGISSTLLFSCCVEDFSRWLKSGNSKFQTAQTTEGINRFSPDLYKILLQSMRVKCF